MGTRQLPVTPEDHLHWRAIERSQYILVGTEQLNSGQKHPYVSSSYQLSFFLQHQIRMTLQRHDILLDTIICEFYLFCHVAHVYKLERVLIVDYTTMWPRIKFEPTFDEVMDIIF